MDKRDPQAAKFAGLAEIAWATFMDLSDGFTVCKEHRAGRERAAEQTADRVTAFRRGKHKQSDEDLSDVQQKDLCGAKCRRECEIARGTKQPVRLADTDRKAARTAIPDRRRAVRKPCRQQNSHPPEQPVAAVYQPCKAEHDDGDQRTCACDGCGKQGALPLPQHPACQHRQHERTDQHRRVGDTAAQEICEQAPCEDHQCVQRRERGGKRGRQRYQDAADVCGGDQTGGHRTGRKSECLCGLRFLADLVEQ